MAHVAGRLTMKIITVLVTIPVGIATKKVVERTWTAARPADAPRKPGERDVRWQDAVGWAALSGAGIVVTNLVARKGAEEVWRTLVGGDPPPRKLTKHEKKMAKEERGLAKEPAESRPAT
ncbi:MAG: DUF4235 domain-containing protein [Pseudonocardiales bacterium]